MLKHFGFSANLSAVLLMLATPTANFCQVVRGSILERARKAKMRGENTLYVAPPIPLPLEMPTADDAISMLSALLVTKVASTTIISGDTQIVTWYKLRIAEVLSLQAMNTDSYPLPPDVPQGLLPLKADEILVPESGGTVMVEDVKVTGDGDDLEGLKGDQKYVVFGTLSCSSKMLRTVAGRSLIYSVGEADLLTSLSPSPSPISHEIARRGNHSLSGLRISLQNRRN